VKTKETLLVLSLSSQDIVCFSFCLKGVRVPFEKMNLGENQEGEFPENMNRPAEEEYTGVHEDLPPPLPRTPPPTMPSRARHDEHAVG